ncbi:MAG TPA: S49 family peptidase [Xanthobacteraceae bacterium]|jgi:serine protease SohB|nr:S49 family peptidase [Xanthobacteraceae bacterium]
MTETTTSSTTIPERALEILKAAIPRRFRSDIPVVPVVRLTGIIGYSTPLRPGLTISSIARSLERAFAVRNAKAVALAINSPGGSAVQSHLIFRRIRQLAEQHDRRVIAFVEDVAASGGYMIACAADEIISDPSSIVGSIGVVGGAFGFTGLIEKLGIERRLYTSGEHKAMLDPFLPEKPDDVQRLKAIQSEIHETFMSLVKSRRTGISGPESTLFSGEYWTGRRARELGLVDQLGDLRSILRERYGEKVATPLISADRGLFGRRIPGVGSFFDRVWQGPGLAEDVVSALEARAYWSRYGL